MPQIPISNRFYKGIDSDTSYTERDGQTYLDAQNFRIVRREGNTLFAATLGGTEERITLPPTYVPMGSVYHRGVLFLIIHSEITGSSQIGCYPSPDPTNGYAYERVYRPLLFTKQAPWTYLKDGCEETITPVLQPLQTTDLGLNLDYALGVEARGEADGSATIYWTDGQQPIRLANTCFNIETGRPTGRYISEKELQGGQWDLVNESRFHPQYQLLSVSSGGAMKAGHVFVTVRYTDTQYGNTSFLNFSSAIPVFNSTGGGIPIGGESDEITDKQITVLLSGLDPDAAMIEVGWIRYTSDTEYEASLVATRYILDGTGTLTVTITGREATVPLAIDEVIALKPYDARTAFCMAQVNNTLYVANTKGRQLDHPDLRSLACLIELDEHVEELGTIQPINNAQPNQVYGGNANDVFGRVGYFSGEVYTFAILPVLKGGFYGLPIPVHGTDHYTGSSVGMNDNGCFRFSNTSAVPYSNNVNAIAKAIKMLTGNATVANFIAGSQWIQDNVEGFYVCRAERKENLLYQGLQLYAYNGNVARQYQRDFVIPGTVDELFSKYLSPFFEPATYGVLMGKDHGGFAGSSDVAGFAYYAGAQTDAKRQLAVKTGKACIVSHDFTIGKRDVPAQVHVRRIQNTSYEFWDRVFDIGNAFNVVTKPLTAGSNHEFLLDGLEEQIEPLTADGYGTTHFVGYDQAGPIGWSFNAKYDTEAVSVQAWNAVPTGEGLFVSRREEGASAQQDGLYFVNPNYFTFEERNKDFSLPIANPSYIGIEQAPFDMFPYDSENDWNHAVVGVYRSDPDTVTVSSYYQPLAEFYYPIGDYIALKDFATQDHIRWQGDCFIGRVYQRLVSGHSESIGSELLDLIAQKEAVVDPNYPEIDLEKGWGYWVSYVAEHKYNPQYRIEKGRNFYYPGSGVGSEGDFAWLLDSPESDFYNNSYTRMLGGRGLLPLDPLQPTSSGEFGTRIRASFTHVTGAVRDGYRQFAEVDKFDAQYKDGKIYALKSIGEQLYSIQETAINLHPINERITNSTSNGSTFVTGGLQKLPPYRIAISETAGAQHRFGVVVGGNGLYGYDYRRRIMWRVMGSAPEDLTVKRSAQSFLYAHLPQPLLSDRVGDVEDKPLRGKGVQMVVYGEYSEVWLTLYGEDRDKTIMYSELIDAFQGRVSVQPRLYTPMAKELIAWNGDNRGHQHDAGTGEDIVFYGVQQKATMKFVCGQSGEDTKHWDSMVMNQNNTKWSKIRYETQHQRAEQDFDNFELAYKPYYRENQWKQPIRRADSTIEPPLSIFEQNSPLRGVYIIVELEYENNKPLWLREVIINATPSKA